MPKSKKVFCLVQISQGVLDWQVFQDANEELHEALAKIDSADKDKDKFALFGSEPIPFAVDTAPRVTIGAPKTRKKREKKPATLGKGNVSKAKNGNTEHTDRT